MISETWTGKDTEESGRNLTFYPGICLKGLKKTRKNQLTLRLRDEIRPPPPPPINTNQEC
jgi:hypothetical protein